MIIRDLFKDIKLPVNVLEHEHFDRKYYPETRKFDDVVICTYKPCGELAANTSIPFYPIFQVKINLDTNNTEIKTCLTNFDLKTEYLEFCEAPIKDNIWLFRFMYLGDIKVDESMLNITEKELNEQGRLYSKEFYS